MKVKWPAIGKQEWKTRPSWHEEIMPFWQWWTGAFEQRAHWNPCCAPAAMSIALSEVGSCWERQTTRPCKTFLSTEIRFVSRHYLLAFGPADTAISSFSFAITMGNNGERDLGSWQSTHFGTSECCHGKLQRQTANGLQWASNHLEMGILWNPRLGGHP